MNIKLKLAILLSGTPQYRIAQRAEVEETRLSKAIHGRVNLSLDEKERLAAVLGRPMEELFPKSAENKNEDSINDE